jgi:hypothetical protein
MEQKTEVPGIYKAGEGVLINKDNMALQAYKNRKNRERRLIKVEEDLNGLKSDISEIKELMKGLLHK